MAKLEITDRDMALILGERGVTDRLCHRVVCLSVLSPIVSPVVCLLAIKATLNADWTGHILIINKYQENPM